MCCTREELDKLTEEELNLCPTHIAPSYTTHPRTGDVYSAYNKPLAVIDWLARNDVAEEYVLIIDADMIMRKPFLPEAAGAKPGTAVSALFGYMKGVTNNLALKHIPEVTPHNDTLAGPSGRRGDQVGGFTLMNTQDLRRMAPLWLKYTEDVRVDPDAWELSGDAYSTHKGDKPWISEMYGYSFGAAKAGVWHVTDNNAMLYPGYDVLEEPMVLHYGLLWNVEGTDYSFDKHWHYGFDPLACPPWDLNKRKPTRGLFPHPPAPSSFNVTGFKLLSNLLGIEVPIRLNKAFCQHHRSKCPPSEELTRECDWVDVLEKNLDEAYATLKLPDPCIDNDDRCKGWATDGECEVNPSFMRDQCRRACRVCLPRHAEAANTPSVRAHGVAEGTAQHQETTGAEGGKEGDSNAGTEGEEEDDDDTPDLEHKEGVVAADQTKGSAAHLRGGGGGGGGRGGVETVLTTRTEEIPKEIEQVISAEEGENALAKTKEDRLKEAEDLVVEDEEREEVIGAVAEEDVGVSDDTKKSLLRKRCTMHPRWDMLTVKRCLALAAEGVEIPDPDAVVGDTLGAGHDLSRMLGQRFRKAHIGSWNGEKVVDSTSNLFHRLGLLGMVAWGLAALVVLCCLPRFRKRSSSKPHGTRYYNGAYARYKPVVRSQ